MSVRVLRAGSAAPPTKVSELRAAEEIGADRPQRKLVSRLAARRPLIVLAVALVCAGAAIGALHAAAPSVTTDNAYLKSDSTVVAPRVKGQVAEILVADNAVVEKGQPLVRIDPEEYAARVSSAQGDLELADAQVAAARAAQDRVGAELDLAQANVREAGAGIRAGDAEVVRTRADRQRYEALAEQGVVARRDVERVRSDAISAEAAAERTRASLAVSHDQATVAARRRGEASAQLLAAQAQRAKAAATLTLARQDADHALIRAPVAGVVADRQVNAGDYVEPGTRLLTLVPARALHVIANFKETQTERMLPGQAAVVKVDALPGVDLKAHVESLAPGSGSEFALLPFEPGAGNFTKVVQRVPVRLTFDPGQPELARLRPGLSAKVAVRFAPSSSSGRRPG